MKKIINLFIIGVAFGAVIYLSLITLKFQPNIPTLWNTISVLIISGFIGISSIIFQLESLSWTTEILLHFIFTVTLVFWMVMLNGWHFKIGIFLIVLVIYILVWTVVLIQQWSDIKKVNEALINRKRD